MAKTFEAIQKMGKPTLPSWQFLDLKKRKQTGDLDKKILFFKNKKNFKVFNFTSSRPEEGVSTVIANLVHYIKCKKNDQKYLLIDANFKAPNLHSIFQLKTDGLAEIFAGKTNLTAAIQEIGSTNLHAVSCGRDYNSMAGNIDQKKFDAVLTEARELYDYIIIDSSPILTSSDAITTAVVSDVTFVVLQAMEIQRDSAIKAKSLLEDNECIIGGVILNRTLQVIPSWAYKIF